jgi:hypothetical protein
MAADTTSISWGAPAEDTSGQQPAHIRVLPGVLCGPATPGSHVARLTAESALRGSGKGRSLC